VTELRDRMLEELERRNYSPVRFSSPARACSMDAGSPHTGSGAMFSRAAISASRWNVILSSSSMESSAPRRA
jgi:hypothetical protein